MGLQRWNAFREEHGRAFVIFADLDSRSQARFEILVRLIQSLRLNGDYAFAVEGDVIRAALSREEDASKVAAAVQAHTTAREDGWAGQWAFRLDAVNEAAVAAYMQLPPARRSSGTRTRAKFRRRRLPI